MQHYETDIVKNHENRTEKLNIKTVCKTPLKIQTQKKSWGKKKQNSMSFMKRKERNKEIGKEFWESQSVH